MVMKETSDTANTKGYSCIHVYINVDTGNIFQKSFDD